MADIIRNFQYKTPGRGKGILGLKDLTPCRRPGEKAKEVVAESAPQPNPRKEVSQTVVVALYDYKAHPDSPGGFKELTVKKGQILELVSEMEENEHWWSVRNEEGEEGCVPASYVIKKEHQPLPWLELQALQTQEAERIERVKRLQQQKEAKDGKGFGPVPKSTFKPYTSAYGKGPSSKTGGSSQYYCEVCEKQLNGPKPYNAHMASKAHKEELALLEN